MNLKSQISNLKSTACDLCGGTEADFILTTKRLDGPLMCCRKCGLYFVSVSSPTVREGVVTQVPALADAPVPVSEQVAAEMVRLAERARDLALVEPDVEQGEQPWRELMARERLNDLKRFVGSGRLLEVGCSTGEMLATARESFDAVGVEADSASSRVASQRGLQCFNGALADAKFGGASFDVAALYHVIEHFPSPRAEMVELHRVMKPGGWLAIETPNIANFWFRLLGARWRQFIPDHIFFFTPQTLTRLCEDTGFEIVELRNVGKAMSLRLLISRIGRYHSPTARLLSAISRALKLDDLTVRLNFGDVMRLYARRK
ncbi:MAG: class I SAM-dependent methyltransferase [Blastocatellia bacterium]